MKSKGKSGRKAVILHIGSAPEALPKKQKINWKEFLWDKAEFLVVSAFVFVISYAVLNYDAIYENVRFQFFGNHSGEREAMISRNEISDKPAGAGELQVSVLGAPVASTVQASSIPIPALDISIVPPDTRLIIPRIEKNIPVVGVNNESLIARDWDDLEKDIQNALRGGVVHYPGTALPGEIGNIVFTGHSSYYAWDPGRFKDVFALLHQVKGGDRVYVYHNQKKYTYEVFDIRVVKPDEIDVLQKTNDQRLTLITCTPLGTNLKRLVVTAKLIQE